RMAPPSRPWVLVTQLSKFAEVKFLPADASTIDPGINLLLIVHPKNLGEQALYAIDQYLVKGGSAFIAVDPYCSVDQPKTDAENPMAAMTADRSSNLKSLMQAWGVKLVERKVVADIDMATKVSSGQTRDQQLFPVWLTLGSDAAGAKGLVNRSNIVTSQLENVMLAWPGALELSKVDGVTVESLLQTTDTAMLFDEQTIRFSGDNPDQILKDYQRGSQSYTLAVRIGGKLKSAFPGKPGEKQQENMSTADGHTAQGVKDANIIVIADVDFLADRYAAYVQQFLGTQIVTLINDNLVLAANAVENLAAGSADLISLRSRGKYTRPFTRVQAIEARAAEKWKLEEE
ncbi:MAG TPA: Gldg family protein, partial [Oligoflexia bacterium]|nr:Gldg family protein [Oligoflexia bacterium]